MGNFPDYLYLESCIEEKITFAEGIPEKNSFFLALLPFSRHPPPSPCTRLEQLFHLFCHEKMSLFSFVLNLVKVIILSVEVSHFWIR